MTNNNIYEIPMVKKDDMQIPARWVLKSFLSLEPPRIFHVSELKDSSTDINTLNQFLNEAHKFNLVIRLQRGEYFAPPPNIAIETFAMDDYHSKLILLNSLFDHLNIQHVFLCISTNIYADYIPDRVMPVLKREPKEFEQEYIDHFVYDFKEKNTIEMKFFDNQLRIPTLSKKETAILLLSTYIPREINAGKEILNDVELDQETKDILKGMGYVRYGGKKVKKLPIKHPKFIKKWMEEIGINKLKEVGTR